MCVAQKQEGLNSLLSFLVSYGYCPAALDQVFDRDLNVYMHYLLDSKVGPLHTLEVQ